MILGMLVDRKGESAHVEGDSWSSVFKAIICKYHFLNAVLTPIYPNLPTEELNLQCDGFRCLAYLLLHM
jgi:hypothetical protein